MSSLKFKLIAVLSILAGGFLAMSFMAWSEARVGERGLAQVYADRVVPLRDLKQVSDAYAVALVDNAHKMRAGTVPFETGAKVMADALGTAERLWAGYMQTYMDGREKALAGQAVAAMTAARGPIAELQGLIAAKDSAGLARFVTDRLYPTIDPVTEAVGRLVDLQVEEAQKSYEETQGTYRTMLALLAALALAGAVAAVFGFRVVLKGVIGPIEAMTESMAQLSRGNLAVEIPGAKETNEIGRMAAAVAVFKENGLARERLEREQAEERALSDRRAAAVDRLVRDFDKAMGAIVGAVSSAATELEASAQSLTAGAEETSNQSTAVSAASEEASSNVRTVAAAAEALAGSVEDISRQVSHSTRIAATAVAEAQGTVDLMRQLSAGAQKIGEIVDLIGNVAGQTNLLALNATIEAARAGEAGRGFAVVAAEVKGLADQTAKASAQIAQQIAEIQGSTSRAETAIGSVSATIQQMNEIAGGIAASVDRQATTTQEIARNVQQASVGTSEVSLNISGVTRAAEETSAGAGQVLGASGELARQADRLKREVATFLDAVRAA
ncbi:methyl-accepting chemotaxis protein [Prosthecomicrobium sp. N25]|uniref:methyl-accepting chemotaxis protein n=1 Tax=Prosthecomicrobium sp. N25 TaxID=3129254 RepID=UPI003077D7EA